MMSEIDELEKERVLTALESLNSLPAIVDSLHDIQKILFDIRDELSLLNTNEAAQ